MENMNSLFYRINDMPQQLHPSKTEIFLNNIQKISSNWTEITLRRLCKASRLVLLVGEGGGGGGTIFFFENQMKRNNKLYGEKSRFLSSSK